MIDVNRAALRVPNSLFTGTQVDNEICEKVPSASFLSLLLIKDAILVRRNNRRTYFTFFSGKNKRDGFMH